MNTASPITSVYLSRRAWPRRWLGAAVLTGWALAATSAAAAQPAARLTFTVNSTLDAHDVHRGDGVCADAAGKCTLRAAIEEANALPDGSAVAVRVPSGAYALTLGSLTLLTQHVDIRGLGSHPVVVDGRGTYTDVVIGRGAEAALDGLTITGGREGGIDNYGRVTVTDSTIARNPNSGIYNDGTALLAGDIITGNASGAGGIENFRGTLTVISSTISNNFSTGLSSAGIDITGGAVTILDSTISHNNNNGAAGGGIRVAAPGVLTVTNSTISANYSFINMGDGVTSSGPHGGGAVTLTYDTIAGNASGLATIAPGGTHGMITLVGTIVANDPDGPNCVGPQIISRGYNLDSGATCGFNQPTDLNNTRPLLGPLADNGGPTRTMAPRPGSPAIDAGGSTANGCPATDQRGVPRPRGPACDIGAFELAG